MYAVVLSSVVQGLTLRPYYSKMSYLQAKKFFYVGNLMAMSLLHGSCGFPYLAPPMYQYLCRVDISAINISIEDIPNNSVKQLLQEVQ